MNDGLPPHTTIDEIAFVRSLSNPSSLRGYIRSLSRRTDWTSIDHDLVQTAAEQRLAEVEKRKARR